MQTKEVVGVEDDRMDKSQIGIANQSKEAYPKYTKSTTQMFEKIKPAKANPVVQSYFRKTERRNPIIKENKSFRGKEAHTLTGHVKSFVNLGMAGKDRIHDNVIRSGRRSLPQNNPSTHNVNEKPKSLQNTNLHAYVLDEQKPRSFQTPFPNIHVLNDQKQISHPDKYSNVLSLNDQTRKRIYTNPSLATYTKSKHSLGFKVEPQIVQSVTKINFDEWKQEEKFSTQTLHRPTGPPKRFVNLGTQRNTKKKVFTRSIGNFHTKKRPT